MKRIALALIATFALTVLSAAPAHATTCVWLGGGWVGQGDPRDCPQPAIPDQTPTPAPVVTEPALEPTSTPTPEPTGTPAPAPVPQPTATPPPRAPPTSTTPPPAAPTPTPSTTRTPGCPRPYGHAWCTAATPNVVTLAAPAPAPLVEVAPPAPARNLLA